MNASVSVLVLAGQRENVVDPLCQEAGVTHKAMLPIVGKPMIEYVFSALDKAGLRQPYHISGKEIEGDERLSQSPQGLGPAGSAHAALAAGIHFPCIVTTCDHPLLTEEILSIFVAKSIESEADFCVGLAEKNIIQPAYPNVKRTYLNFADKPVSGCNLFYIANEKGLRAIEFWQQAQHLRKSPLKLTWRVGPSLLISYVLGRLTLKRTFDYASNKLNLKIKPILIPVAEAAIDVDKPSDKLLVETIIKARSRDA